jgi:hypothetical protein
MAYIRAEEVKAIRDELKLAYPKFKFGVRKNAYGSTVQVTIKQGPADFSDICDDSGYKQINHYHLGNYGHHQKFFEDIEKIIKTAPVKAGGREWYDESDAMTDYFNTAYYFDISIGNYDQPYACTKEYA